jgi:hypothetical protein
MSKLQQRQPDAVRPADYALRSAESRAAARIVLEHRRQCEERGTIWNDIRGVNSYPKGHDPTKPYLNWSMRGTDGKIWRCAYLPPGMNCERAERLLAGAAVNTQERRVLQEE